MFSPGLRIYGLGGHRTLFTRTVYTTPTRQLGVVYQNTTGRPLIVLGGEESMSGTMIAYCDASKNLWFIASGRTSSLGQISSAVSAGQNQIMISTWANDDVAAWGIAQPVELYYETAGFSSTLSHWFEYQLG